MTTTYRNQVAITFFEINGFPGTPPVDAYEVIIHPADGMIDLDWLTSQLEEFYWTTDPETGGRVVATDHVLKREQTDVHWGAAGASAQFVIEAATLLSAEIFSIALVALVDELRRRGHNVRHGRVQQLTESQASTIGLGLIEIKRNVPVSNLRLRSVADHEVAGRYAVSAVAPDGSSYSATFTMRGGRATDVRHKHELA